MVAFLLLLFLFRCSRPLLTYSMRVPAVLIVLLTTQLVYAQPLPIGVVQSMQYDSVFHRAGYQCLVLPVSETVSARIPRASFLSWVHAKEKLNLPVCALNLFLPGDLKVVGPEVDEPAILAYTDTVFSRCRQAGIKRIVWGSGGSRFIPNGFDREKARSQFVAIAKKISVQAHRFGVELALENLNRKETNFINTLEEALAVAQEVNEPAFRICADLYHMQMEQEPAEVIVRAARWIVHVDMAENETRTPPGTHQQDVTAYLRALKRIDYQGPVVMECRWEHVGRQAGAALQYLSEAIQRVWRTP